MARQKNQPEEHDPTLGPAVAAVHVGGESIVDRLLPHAKKIGLMLVGAALLVAAIVLFRIYQRNKAEKSTRRLTAALELVERQVKEADDGAMPAQAPDREVYATRDERTQAVSAAMGKIGQTRGAVSLVEAQVLLRGGKLDEALAIYRKRAKVSGIDGLVAREGVGITLEAKALASTDPAAKQKLLEEALEAFRAIQPDDKGQRRDYALYHEGRILEALGKNAEAKAALEKALAVVPDTTLEPAIRNRLSSLGGA